MMISYGWTWPAFVARAKDTTRRGWSLGYARRWRAGMEFGAYDRNPMYGGNLIGRGVLICDPVHEPLSAMPDEDYEREGFAWLAAHIQVLPPAAYSQGWAPCTRAKFAEWRATSDVLYTVRFRILEVTPAAMKRLERLLEQAALPFAAEETRK